VSINGASTSWCGAFWILSVLIDHRHPFFRWWLPLLAKTTATSSLPHPEKEYHQSFNNVYLRIIGNLCSDLSQAYIYQILGVFTGKNNSGMLPAAFCK
jgi:hypothetical protein